ncbi:MAG: type II toxin-antitoxin system RelB/DinJ family antitoxin [Phascolarctobacterium sp.]|nr:type II toxin-antitoxin system RelB/DinJ family antitoxin [Phascolarctobacterium sp.]
MAQAIVSFRMDAELKRGMEETCRRMGLTMTSAFTMFATMVNRTQSIPFKIAVDPFYSEENMEELRHRILDIKTGNAKMVEHELIEME